MIRRLASAALAVALAGPAAAHPMPNSVLLLEIRPGMVELSASIPASELEAAGGVQASEVGRYLVRHATVTGADGHSWPPEVHGARSGERDGHRTLDATLLFKPRPGRSNRAAVLRYNAVTHRIASHYVLVYRRVEGALTPLGRLQSPETQLTLP